MAKGDVALVAGLAGFLLGGAAVYLGGGASKDVRELRDEVRNVQKSDEESLAALGEKVAKVDTLGKDLARRVNRLDAAPGSGDDRYAALETRVAALEAARAGGPPPKDAGPGSTGTNASDGEFEDLSAKVSSGSATADEQARFWQLLREDPQHLADWMEAAKKAVAERPRDKQAHRQLAQVYLAKLMSVPDGMEKGIWSNKMIGEERAILDIDPNDWDARFSVATNYSFWPEQFNKRPDAIKEFETLRKVQEQTTPEPKHAQTYFQLRQLYLKDGRTDDAKAVLDEGLRRFPDDAELKKARDGAK